MNDHEVCLAHSGLTTEVDNLKEDLNKMGRKVDTMMTRLNVILGGIIILIIGVLADIVFRN